MAASRVDDSRCKLRAHQSTQNSLILLGLGCIVSMSTPVGLLPPIMLCMCLICQCVQKMHTHAVSHQQDFSHKMGGHHCHTQQTPNCA